MSEANQRMADTWARLRAARRPGLVVYLTAGFPSRAASLEALRAADDLADVIEVGVPFSDPLADGPTIQRSTHEALRLGMSVEGTLELVRDARLRRPVVLFTYLNPVLRYGLARFLREAEALEVSGLLLTDVPAGADAPLEETVQQSSIDLIRLVAPTTADARLHQIAAGARGFLYLVSRLGVTGASPTVSPDLDALVARVRAVSTAPLAVGFGISTGEQAARVGRLADGVVIGSALVERLGTDGVAGVRALLASLRRSLDQVEAAA